VWLRSLSGVSEPERFLSSGDSGRAAS
jgi:hypothetical protein